MVSIDTKNTTDSIGTYVSELLDRIFRREPKFPYLEAFLETREMSMREPGIAPLSAAIALFSVVGWGGFVGSLVLGGPAWLTFGCLVGMGVGIAGALGFFFANRKARRNALPEIVRESEPAVATLLQLKRGRRLDRSLGPGAGELLNQGARYWVETQQVLNGGVWTRVQPDSVWAGARLRALSAIESAMLRLVLVVVQGSALSSEFLAPALEPGIRLADEMREMCNQVKQLSDKLNIETPLHAVDPAANELRQTLSELKQLEQAQEEVNRLGGFGT